MLSFTPLSLSLSLDQLTINSIAIVNNPAFKFSQQLKHPHCFIQFLDRPRTMDYRMLVPPWLEPLLNTAFFSVCGTHAAAARSESNMYCLDCNDGSFCFYCRSSNHKDHQVIQIRRSSYHDVVRVSEIEKVIDISGVQTYVINSARVLFLNERPQPRSSKGSSVSHLCEICGRSLLDPFRFCSLGCKLVGIKRNGNASFTLEAKEGVGMERSEGRMRGGEELLEGSQQNIYPPIPTSSARRRKGIPHRAPFGSI